LRGLGAAAHSFDGARREADRRETGRHTEALLRARIDSVDAPAVDLDGDATERRDRVDEQQRVGALQRAQRRDLVLDAGRRLGMHDRDDARVRRGLLRVEQLLRVERAAPRRFDAYDGYTAPPRDFTHPFTEHAVDTD